MIFVQTSEPDGCSVAIHGSVNSNPFQIAWVRATLLLNIRT